MSNHIPDAGKMVCPHCGAEKTTIGTVVETYACYSFNPDESRNPKMTIQSNTCVTRERDKLRARVEELEIWIRSLETHPDSDGHHKSIDLGWQWVAKGRQIYVGKPKPEGLR
jgi:hypothetical protein